MDWNKAYPGDDVVDIISMDVHDEYNHGWSDVVGGSYGLAAFRQFARRHGKSEAYTEWSVSANTPGHGDDTVQPITDVADNRSPFDLRRTARWHRAVCERQFERRRDRPPADRPS